MQAFLNFNLVSKALLFPSSQSFQFASIKFDFVFCFLLLDYALLGHAIDTVTVVDEFECQFKCIGNKSCKSFNVRIDGSNAKRRICELNNKTRQMKPGNFKWKKGCTYYGSVQVS